MLPIFCRHRILPATAWYPLRHSQHLVLCLTHTHIPLSHAQVTPVPECLGDSLLARHNEGRLYDFPVSVADSRLVSALSFVTCHFLFLGSHSPGFLPWFHVRSLVQLFITSFSASFLSWFFFILLSSLSSFPLSLLPTPNCHAHAQTMIPPSHWCEKSPQISQVPWKYPRVMGEGWREWVEGGSGGIPSPTPGQL